MTTIIVTQEDGEVDEFDFGPEAGVIGLGRRPTNDVCIPDRSVSALHARISREADRLWIEDLNSTNGTYVNGRLISRQRLEEGDEIILGRIRVTFAEPPDAARGGRERGGDDARASEPAPDGEAPREETSMSLSDKARMALGRETAPSRPHLQAVDPGEAPSAEGAPQLARREPDAPRRDDEAGAAAPPPRPVVPPHSLDGLDDGIAQQPMHDLDNDRTPSRGAVIEIKNGAKSGQILPIDKPVTTLGRPGIQIAAIMRKPDGYFLMHIESDDSIERPTLNRDSIGDEPVLLHSGDELNVAGIDVEFMLS